MKCARESNENERYKKANDNCLDVTREKGL